ncbi:MAG: peptide chain release factor N(5)-glutamine methyltransferase [Bacteroidales bacterium]
MALEISDNRIFTLYKHYSGALQRLYDEREAQALARQVFDELLHIPPSRLLAEPDRLLTESEILAIHFAFKDLLEGKPIQYVMGKAFFRGFELQVQPGVLIPRPETEELVEWIVENSFVKQGCRILDIGTGSGCIALSLALELKNPTVFALDNSDTALSVARANARKHQAEIIFLKADILEPETWSDLPQHLDVIVSNPPYVRQSERAQMHINVKAYEPEEALFVPDEDPLKFYRAIAKAAHSCLKQAGRLYFEINEEFAKETAQLLNATGFRDIEVKKDFRGKDRFVRAIHP